MSDAPVLEAVPLDFESDLPEDAQPRRLVRRALPAVALLAVLVAVIVLARGSETRASDCSTRRSAGS